MDEAPTGMNWDLRSYFPEFNGSEMKEFKGSLTSDIDRLMNLSESLDDLNEGNFGKWSEVLTGYEGLVKRFSHIRSYVACLTSVDSNNQDYLKEEADLSRLDSDLEKIEVEILRAFKGANEQIVERLGNTDVLKGSSYFINRLKTQSEYRMTREKEILTSDLGVDGINSWGRLYNIMSAKLTFDMEYPDGKKDILPISQRRSLLEHSDRNIRKAAFHGGNEAWSSVDYIAAASLNSIAGTRITLNRHRGIDHFLDVALFQSGISRETLEAMFEAINSCRDIPTGILELKADIMGTEGISWYDLGAELDLGERQEIKWDNAKSIIQESFDASYPALGRFFSEVCDDNWIEWEPRTGKRPGGFCTTSLLSNESRIFMTYSCGIGDIVTLAHETGHAYHSSLLKNNRPFSRFYPMTLAECASTFAEMVLTNGMLKSDEIDDNEKKYIFNSELDHGVIFLMDIPVRFEFEKKFYEERGKGTVSVNRLYELMTETQENVFGDILLEHDPFFWISKLHFYITGLTFYNFPYTFGYLLSRALFKRFTEQGNTFLKDFEKLLKSSGSGDCETVIMDSIGEDIKRPEFWTESINSLKTPVAEFRKLVKDDG